MNNLDPIIKKNSQWLKKKGVSDNLIKQLEKNAHMRQVFKSGQSKYINPIAIKRKIRNGKRSYDALDEFSKLATSAEFKPVLAQDKIAEFACSHRSVLTKLTNFKNRKQQEATKKFLHAASKMDSKKQKVFLKQKTFELYLEGKLKLDEIEDYNAIELQNKINETLYDEKNEERRVALNHVITYTKEINASEVDNYKAAAKALPYYQPIGKLAFVFNADFSEVRVYRKTSKSGYPTFCGKKSLSPFDSMRFQQNPSDANLLNIILDPLEEKYTSSVIGVIKDKEQLSPMDYYKNAEKLLIDDAMNKEAAGKVQEIGTPVFVFNADKTEVSIYRKSANAALPIEFCATEKIPDYQKGKSLQEISSSLEMKYGTPPSSRKLREDKTNYRYGTGDRDPGNFLGKALENFEKAYWAYPKDSHRDEAFTHLHSAINGANSKQELDHVRRVYNDMRDQNKSPLKRGFGMRNKRRLIEQHFKDRELQFLRKQTKSLNSIQAINSFKRNVETDKRFSGVKNRNNRFSSFMRSYRKDRNRQTEEDKLIEDIEQLESFQNEHNELKARLFALKHVYNSSKVSGLARMQYKSTEPQIEKLEKEIHQLEMKHREFLAKDGNKNAEHIDLKDYRSLQSDLKQFKTDYKDLVNSLDNPTKEDNKVNKTQQTHLLDNDSTFRFSEKQTVTKSVDQTTVPSLDITHHN